MIFSSSSNAASNLATEVGPFDDKYCQMLPAVKPTRSDMANSGAVSDGVAGLAFAGAAFLVAVAVGLDFLGLASVVTAGLAVAADASVAATSGFLAAGLVGLVFLAAAFWAGAEAASGLVVVAGFSAGVLVFFIIKTG